MGDGQSNDFVMVVGEAGRIVDRPNTHADEGFRTDHDRVCDREHPPAVIPIERIEHVQLSRSEPADPGLVFEGAPDGIRQRFGFMEESARKAMASTACLDQGDAELPVAHGEHRRIDRHRRPRIVGQTLAGGVFVVGHDPIVAGLR